MSLTARGWSISVNPHNLLQASCHRLERTATQVVVNGGLFVARIDRAIRSPRSLLIAEG